MRPDRLYTAQSGVRFVGWFLAIAMLLGASATAEAQGRHRDGRGDGKHRHDRKPRLELAAQGSFFAGGEEQTTELGNSTDPDDPRNPGTATISQTYVEYLIPAKKKFRYPIIMMPGGGHTQKVYETTPDGREGWATYFPRRGLATYLSDGVNRGSSSWDLTNVVLAAQGVIPPDQIPAMDRYTHELAWTQFRIGPEFGVQHPGGQFPVEAFEQYTRQLVPAFRDAEVENAKNIAALVAVVDSVGPSILLGWSQSGNFVVHAALQRPDLVKGVIMLDSGGGNTAVSQLTAEQLAVLVEIPVLALDADFRDAPTTTADILGDNATNIWLPQIGITGNSHVMMLERNNLEIADVILRWIRRNVR